MPLFLNTLKRHGHLDPVQIIIACVGSRKLGGQDDLGTGWRLFAPNLTIYGFDADVDACDAANANLAQSPWREVHYPLALSDQVGEETLYVTKHPMCSSLFPPNEALLSQYAALPDLVNLDFTVQLETTTLDQFCQQEGVPRIDFLQMDVQGAELKVLEGAVEMLPTVLGLQTEVSFSPLYQRQPLFAEVDSYLRQRQFSFFNFEFRGSAGVRRRSPIQSNTRGGQLLWADAIYLRDGALPDLTKLDDPEALDRYFRLACIADVLEFPDYALDLLVELTLGSDRNYADSIVASLAQVPNLATYGLTDLPVVQQLQPYLSDQASEQLG
ncbi:MAG: FkbM family methyltransferase [Cyanobacteria bacterium P01_A01_bin.135]